MSLTTLEHTNNLKRLICCIGELAHEVARKTLLGISCVSEERTLKFLASIQETLDCYAVGGELTKVITKAVAAGNPVQACLTFNKTSIPVEGSYSTTGPTTDHVNINGTRYYFSTTTTASLDTFMTTISNLIDATVGYTSNYSSATGLMTICGINGPLSNGHAVYIVYNNGGTTIDMGVLSGGMDGTEAVAEVTENIKIDNCLEEKTIEKLWEYVGKKCETCMKNLK